ncbi:MAG: LytTR family transcriptional regulator [Spirochaetales bacterium]|nr:LytTR family transcriptional regulator [Spirochaetales bacterium]
MDIRIDSAAGNSEILRELLLARGLGLCDDSFVTFVPRGETFPDRGIVIVYDPANLDELMGFIDSFRELSGAAARQHVVGKKDDKFSILPIARVFYFESMGNYIYCQTVQERFEVNKKLYEIEKDFAGAHFIRINKSCVVNIRWIDEIWPWFGGRLMLKFRETGKKIEVSRNYVKSFKEKLDM